MLPLPTKFFVTSGKAVSKVSDLNAFDEALQNAGLAEQNIVSVSSVLPIGIKAVRRRDLPMGAITHCVLAQQRGGEGERISAGIAFGFRDDGSGGYVAEGHMPGPRNSASRWTTTARASRPSSSSCEHVRRRRLPAVQTRERREPEAEDDDLLVRIRDSRGPRSGPRPRRDGP